MTTPPVPFPAAVAEGQASPVTSDARPVALVYMPWGSVTRGSIALGILKQVLAGRGVPVDIHYLNIRFAEALGVELYNRILDASSLLPEWFFAAPLFGRRGLGLIENDWADLTGDASDVRDRLRRNLLDMVKDSGTTCEAITDEIVPRYIEDCVTRIDWSRYAIVGFSTSFAQNGASLLMAKAIRDRHPSVPIVFGGANADAEMGLELIKGFEWIDYVVHGEAEESFPALVERLAAGERPESVPGVSMRRDGVVMPGHTTSRPLANLNTSPAPDYSDYMREMERSGFQKSQAMSLSFESSRGCWWGAKHHCTFCGLNGTTMAYRKKEAEQVYREIMDLSSTYRCLHLHAVDNILALDYFGELLPRLSEANVDLSLFYEVKANLTRAQMRLMRQAGILQIQPGIESLNSRLLKLMRKGVTAIQNVQLLRWCQEFGIEPAWNILYGFPGELADDYERYPHYFRLLSHLRAPSAVGPVTFERFSPYHFDREAFGLTLQPLDYYQLLYPASRVDLREIAYYFNGVWEGGRNPEGYMGPVHEAAQDWQRRWEAKDTFCYYQRGPGFLTICDNRPLADGSSARKTTLNALQAHAYLFCDEIRSFKAVHERLATQVRPGITPEATRTLLDQFVGAGLMFREEERYLALATRKPAAVTTPEIQAASPAA